jgi:hypothetical protein
MKINVLEHEEETEIRVTKRDGPVCSHCGSTWNNHSQGCKWCDGKGSENPFLNDEGEPYQDYPEKNY